MTQAPSRDWYARERPVGAEEEPEAQPPGAGPLSPIRRRRQATDALNVAAMDFGTSSCTAVLFNDTTVTVGTLDAARARRLRTGMARLLWNTDWPQVAGLPATHPAGSLWTSLMAKISLIAPDLTGPTEVLEELDHDWSGNDSRRDRQAMILDLLCTEVDEYAAQPHLREWAGPLLHEVYSTAMRTAALEDHNLTCVTVNSDGDTDIASILAVSLSDFEQIRLVEQEGVPEHDTVLLRGLKRRLVSPAPLSDDPTAVLPRTPDWQVPAHWPADTDVLIGAAYRDLLRLIERHAAGQPNSPSGAQVESVVVTYPTTTPPLARERLRNILTNGLDLPNVNLVFDEGIAAALFFLMRDFGGRTGTDLAAFRAHCRPTRQPGQWRQNLLVIDIGGGTADIALLALELSDLTPAGQSPQDELFRGRHYRLRPRVLGSSGHPQFGGDLLTLRTFYWLKARIVDALAQRLMAGDGFGQSAFGLAWARAVAAATGGPAGAGSGTQLLAPLVVAFQKEAAAPAGVRQALRALLPTHRAAAGDRAFTLLWGLAERAKHHLGEAGGPFQLAERSLADLADLLPASCAWRGELRHLPVATLALSPDDFQRLVRPVLAGVVRLAADLTREHLATSGAGEVEEVLDRVALSGKSTKMGFVSEVAAEELGRRLSEGAANDSYVAWNAASLTIEDELSKQAPAIGACWAETLRIHQDTRDLTGGRAGDDDSWGRNGQDLIEIEVENLLVNLPCSFVLRDAQGLIQPLLAAGTRLDHCDPDGHLATRSGWRPLRPDIRIHRRISAETTIQWGRYRYQTEAVTKGLSRTTGGGVEQAEAGWFQIEVSQDLIPSINICAQREPHYVLDVPGLDLAPLLTMANYAGPGLAPRLPWELHVWRVDQHGARTTVAVFTDLAERAGHPMPVRFQEIEPLGEEVRGVIGGSPLPAPLPAADDARTLRFQFVGIPAGGGEPVPLGELPVPPTQHGERPPAGLQYFATLDERARLRVHPGYPRYLPADDLDQVHRVPGSVLRAPMDPFRPEWDRDLDPFTGEH